ncbi:MAG: hypothetical protein KDA58_17505, partial [Planctomycetaceae bacterium]|nr:hypothetical protein [Planctomycetaceae bacterium]
LTSVVPVSLREADAAPVGVFDELVPELLAHLRTGQAAALLKAYHRRLNERRMQTVLQQLAESGKTLLTWYIEQRLLPGIKPSDNAKR